MKRFKKSYKLYRNLNGKHYEHHTSNAGDFEKCKKECKDGNLSFRIINGEFFKETKNNA